MKQVIRREIKEDNGIKYENNIYTLLLDMNSIMKMAISADHRVNLKGVEYGMVFQTLLQIKMMLNKKDWDFVYAMYDGYKSGELRYSYYPDYKIDRGKEYEGIAYESEYDKKIAEYCRKVIAYHQKNRKPVKRSETDDESFRRQREIIQKMLDELFIRQVMCDYVEGDDLIAYYVKHKKENEKIVIFSGDRDLTQLISDDACVYVSQLKKFVTPSNHVELIGYTHENVLLKKVICGDASDSIKGIKGVGEKTFFNLFPKAKKEKMSLDEVINECKLMSEERKNNKKKPLKSIDNIINRITDGCQGEKIYEINTKIIDLSNPLLTKEAIDEMDNTMYAPIDPEGRDYKNIYSIVTENGMADLMDEKNFGSFFGSFEGIKKKEIEYFKKNI